MCSLCVYSWQKSPAASRMRPLRQPCFKPFALLDALAEGSCSNRRRRKGIASPDLHTSYQLPLQKFLGFVSQMVARTFVQ